MITAIDTSILLDVFYADPKHGSASAQALRRAIREGALTACELVWAEAAVAFENNELFVKVMHDLGVGFSPIAQETALAAGLTWRKYRAAGGRRTRVAADFLIGAHAKLQCDYLLTRDKDFYKNYFKGVRVIDPSISAPG